MPAERVSSDTELLEREAEVDLLSAQLAGAASGAGCVIWIEASAGVGKTSLVEVAARQAVKLDMLVLQATGHEPEQLHPFGVVRQLFESPVRRLTPADRDGVFAGAAAKARPLVDVHIEPSQDVTEPAAFFHGLYWLTAALAAESPIAVLVDDLQWVDEQSLSFLAYLGRRTEDLPVAMVAASRPLGPDSSGTATNLWRTASLQLRPRELSTEATAVFVSRLLAADDDDATDPTFATACHRATGGNPFYLGELARALRDAGVKPTAAAVRNVEQVVSGELTRSVLRRLGRLGREAGAVARAVAVLGDGAQVRHVAAVAELPETAVSAAADQLTVAGVLLPGLPLRFTHPIIELAVYDEHGAALRAEAHARAARALLSDGAPGEVVAHHLLETEPLGDAEAGAVLDGAAHRALAVGGAAAALRYLERALQEPADAATTAGRHHDAGVAARLAGDAAASVDHLEAAVRLSPTPADRLTTTLELANGYHIARRIDDAVQVLTQSIENASDDHARLALTAGLAGVAISGMRFDLVARSVEPLAQRLSPATPVERELLVYLATLRFVQGVRPREVLGLVKDAVAGGLVADFTADRPPVTWAVTLLLGADELDLAAAVADEAVADALRRGSMLGYGVAATMRAQTLLARGDVAAAEADAEAAYDAVRTAGWRIGIEATAGVLAEVLVERGRFDDVNALVEEHEHDRSSAGAALQIPWARALLAQGRASEAVEVLEPLLRYIVGTRSAVGLPAAVLALHGAGRTAEAVRIGERFTQHPDEAPRVVAGVLRALALNAGADGGGVELARRAVAVISDSPARLDYAYALVTLGELVRRSGARNEARGILREGLDLAIRCGATALAERARQELTSAGARPRRDALTGASALTGTERRVADLAVRGLSNPEIGQALFISRKTVEKHLGSVFAKLAINARADIAEHLGG